MEEYIIEIENKAKKELATLYKSGDKKTIRNIEILFSELCKNPETGAGNPERLKYQISNFWSRRINSKDRLIYKINYSQKTVIILSAKGHYFDK